MPNIGPTEVIILLAVMLLLFGPKRLPQVGRSLGQTMREFKNTLTAVRRDQPIDPQPLSSRTAKIPGE